MTVFHIYQPTYPGFLKIVMFSNVPYQNLCMYNCTCQILVWKNEIHVPTRVMYSGIFPFFNLGYSLNVA